MVRLSRCPGSSLYAKLIRQFEKGYQSSLLTQSKKVNKCISQNVEPFL